MKIFKQRKIRKNEMELGRLQRMKEEERQEKEFGKQVTEVIVKLERIRK
jgi:hypothetical protein